MGWVSGRAFVEPRTSDSNRNFRLADLKESGRVLKVHLKYLVSIQEKPWENTRPNGGRYNVLGLSHKQYFLSCT